MRSCHTRLKGNGAAFFCGSLGSYYADAENTMYYYGRYLYGGTDDSQKGKKKKEAR